MANESIGERIARLRGEREITQAALAREAGITRPQLAAIESGRTANPGVYSLVPLARALNVTLDEVIGIERAQTGPSLIDALNLLIRRTADLGRRPHDTFTPDEFASWALGTSVTFSECIAAIEHLAENEIPTPEGSYASASAAYFVTGAVAGALLERWRR